MNKGKILEKLRRDRHISQKEITRGITSIGTLSKIESGSQEIGYFMFCAFLQRLGKCADKIEIVLSQNEYNIYTMRTEILDGMLKRLDQTELLTTYQELINNYGNLLQQSYMQLYAVNEYLLTGDKEQCMDILKKALKITEVDCPIQPENQYMFCTQEINILTQLAFLDDKEMIVSKEWLFKYILDFVTDIQEQSKVLPQIAWLFARKLYLDERTEECYYVLEKGLSTATESGTTTFVIPILKLEIQCLERMNSKDTVLLKKNQLSAMEFLFSFEGNRLEEELNPTMMIELIQTGFHGELILGREIVKEVRLSKNMTQMELADGICEPETFSRFESGKRNSNKKHLNRIMDKLDMQRYTEYGFVDTDDFEIIENVWKCFRYYAKEDYVSVRCIAGELASELDMSKSVNRQFIVAININLEQETDDTVILQKLLNTLRETMPESTLSYIPRTPFRLESYILNMMTVVLNRMGRRKDAIKIYASIFYKYEASQIRKEYHILTLALFYLNYMNTLEEDNQIDKAKHIGIEGIILLLRCHRGDNATDILANLFCSFYKSGDINMAEKCLENAYYLLMFYGYSEKMNLIKKVYEDTFEKSLP